MLLFFSARCGRLNGQTFVQAVSPADGTSVTNLTVNITTTAGNAVCVFSRSPAGSGLTATITDSAGQSGWTQTASGYSADGTTDTTAMFCHPNSAALTSVKVTWSGTGGTIGAVAWEMNGMAASTMEDASVNNSNGSGTTATSGSLTTTNASDILVFARGASGTTSSPAAGSGFTLPSGQSSARVVMTYKIVSATQSGVTTTITWTSNRTNANIFAGFKASGGGGPPPCTNFIALMGAGCK